MSILRDQLAEYVSHKRVRAGEIVEVDGFHLHVRLADGYVEVVGLTDEQFHRGGRTPQIGDWLVVYGEGDDEYLSISPKKAFEEGYSRTETAKHTHVFEGQPDARQSDEKIAVSRFRPRYRALDDAEKALHDEIKAKAVELEALFGKVKPGRYNSLAMTALEQSVMWIIKELTS